MFSQAELRPLVPLEFAACVFSAYFAGRDENRTKQLGGSRDRSGAARAG